DEQSDQPAREGPLALGSIELWRDQPTAEMFKPIPALLQQARKNLAGSDARDLWVRGIESVKEQRAILARFPVAAPALQATDAFIAWLEQEAPKKHGPSGIGVANYDWYLEHVQLVPYSWSQEVALMERELARARSM